MAVQGDVVALRMLYRIGSGSSRLFRTRMVETDCAGTVGKDSKGKDVCLFQ
jgi:hypothetical protein